MSNLRILLHDYGGYAFTRQLAGELAKRGHYVQYIYSQSTQLVTRCDNSQPEGRLSVNGISLSRPFQKYNFILRRQSEIEHGQLVAAQVEKFVPDIVISANTPLDAQELIQKCCRRQGGKFVFWLQDVIGLATNQLLAKRYPLIGSLVGHFYMFLERRLVSKSDHVILISEDFRLLMSSWRVESEKVAVIPNWAPLGEILPVPKNNNWAKEFGLDDKFCFIYTGILGLKHKPEIFLSLAESFQSCPDVRVVVIAEGPGADWLSGEKEARGLENLVILDYQPYNVYSSVLGAADVLVAILGQDAGVYSVPSKVLSYLCANRPLLLSVPLQNLSARIVEGNQAGLVAPSGDSAAFIESAFRLYQNSCLRQEMAANGLRYAREHFDIQKIADQFEQIIH